MNFCPLYSGSSGNSMYIKSKETCLLIDAGRSVRDIERALLSVGASGKIDGILVTHEHTDHIKSVGAISRKYDVPVYANEYTFGAMEKNVGDIPLKNIRIFNTEQDFFIKDICVYPFSIPHDAADPVGFCLESGGKKISVLTDLGYMPQRLYDIVHKSNVMLIESNHDIKMLQTGPYPQFLKRRILGTRGHLSNDAAADALLKIYDKGVGQVILGHLSEKNNTVRKAVETVMQVLRTNGVSCDLMVAGTTPGAFRLNPEAAAL